MRTLLRLGTVLIVFLGVSFVQLPLSQAIEVPETLAHRQPVGTGPVAPGFSIDHLGVLWDTQGGPDEHADERSEEHGAVRFSVDGTWTAWQPLTEDGAHAEGQWASALVPAGDADAYQVRGIPADAVAPRAVALNTTDGPRRVVGRVPTGGAHAIANCRSRAEWGADENLRFGTTSKEIWPVEFHPVQTMTVHHTATKNNDPDPAATVRAIYRYHAVDRQWGDIGYHYLLDEQGKVYEGRWSGASSASCGTAGGGADFAHDASGKLVTGAHTGGYNSGNMGAALLGNLTTATDGAEPSPVAVDALEALVAELSSRHSLDPHAVVNYLNPVNGYKKTVNMISGHRDWLATECPGERLYTKLPAIRDAVKAQLAGPAVSITSPADAARLTGALTVTASAGAGVTSVAFAASSAASSIGLGTDTNSSDGWSAPWDTRTMADGGYTLTATATAGTRSTTTSIGVTVDNDAAPTVSITSPAAGRTVKGPVPLTAASSDDRGVAQVTFSAPGAPGIVASANTDGSWSAAWDSTLAGDGTHQITATAKDTVGQQSTHTITVTVDNVADPVALSVTGVTPASGNQNTTFTVTISGTGFVRGAAVDLRDGEGTEPLVSNVNVGPDGSTITATFKIKSGGPARSRPWDVAVINPDGKTAVLPDGFTVLR